MRPDPIIVGAYPAEGLARFAPSALASLGPLRAIDDGPLLVVAVGGATPAAARAATGADVAPATAPCLIDGEIANLDALAPGPGTAEQRLHAAWLVRGDQLLDELTGPFAAVLWDAERRRGLVALDPLGLRPVFIVTRGSGIVFGTELEPLFRILASRPAPDEAIVARWLAYDNELGERTLYEGVTRLRGGSRIVLADTRAQLRRVEWLRYEPPLDGSPEDVAAELGACLDGAVARAVGGRGQAAVTLSGGLDSSAVAGLAVRAGRPPHAYSMVFPQHASIDEEALVAHLVAAWSLPWTRLRVRGGGALAGSLQYLRRWGSPDLSVTSSFSGPLLRRAGANGTDVVLDGEGGDELFITRYYAISDALARGDLRRAWQLVSAFPVIGTDPGRRLRLGLLGRWGVRGLLPGRLVAQREDRLDLLRAPLRRAIRSTRRPEQWRLLDGPRGWAFAAEIFRSWCEGRGVAEHLARQARTAGIRERHPLLDVDLIRFVLRFPSHFTFSSTATRPLLRMAMEGLVPDEVRLRSSKSYFTELAATALEGPDGVVSRELLGPGARIRAWADGPALDRLLAADGVGSDRGPWALSLLDVVRLECWLRQQEDDEFATDLLASRRLEPASFEFDEV
jgi:asparagine synthase (glutamine-hydrolysing)